MSRYIKLDDAIASIAGQMSYEIEAETGENTDCLDLAEELLNDIPTVSVVRCKECKHCKKKKGTFRGEPIFFYRCEEHNRDVESDDYCSWGERSDNGKDIQSATE